MDYLKEPFDFKLFAVRVFRKWYQILLCSILGALVFGSVYYVYKVTYAPAKEYKAEAVYYLEYATDPKLSEPYSYFNEYTLNSWLYTDAFTDLVIQNVKTPITKEEVSKYVVLRMESDVRIVTLSVNTPSADLTMELLNAYDSALQVFADNQREIQEIVLQDKDQEAFQITMDIRTQRAFVLGALLGFVSSCIVIMLNILLDDGIYLPETLKKRHGLTALGTQNSEELDVNIAYAVRNRKRVAITNIKEGPELPLVIERCKSAVTNVEWVAMPTMVQCPEAAENLRNVDGILLVVEAAVDKSTMIERVLSYYEQQEITILGAILWDTEEYTIKRYRK